ncbi:MAG: hypothetical protein VBE63_17580 [Lamprobacter sp.]|uniref:hypothetical protein n=1 Tax=Lamprobacter sp. TaxID=3100796 RepID=UPI002B256A9E|nr:hypothetical protein [Lamprobacter sp.]MEA3641729.1 hypothetical protein [Lamprobacter sp.]
MFIDSLMKNLLAVILLSVISNPSFPRDISHETNAFELICRGGMIERNQDEIYLLLKKIPNLNKPCQKSDFHYNDGKTILNLAIDKLQPDVVFLLLKNGANPKTKNKKDGLDAEETLLKRKKHIENSYTSIGVETLRSDYIDRIKKIEKLLKSF